MKKTNDTKAIIDRGNGEILTRRQAASLLSITTHCLDGKIKNGDLRAMKVGKRITRIFRRDLNAFLEKFATTEA
jgi:excisionase family DNA binding protein